MSASSPDLCRWLLPMVAVNLLVMNMLSGNRVLPVISDVTQLLSSLVIVRTVASALVRPFGRPFQVTAKGLSTSGPTIHWRLMLPFVALAAGTLAGMATQIGRYSPAHGAPGYVATIGWSIMNIVVLALAATACVEPAKRRRDERFALHEPALVRLVPLRADGQIVEIPCVIEDLSLGGASLRCERPMELLGPAELVLRGAGAEGELAAPFTVLSRPCVVDGTCALRICFEGDAAMRRALIRKLFTGEYHKEVPEVHVGTVFQAVAGALFS
jgi:cellulose synthase (UDP-forming)